MLTLTKKNFIDLIQTHVPLEEHGSTSSGYCPFCFDDEETFITYPGEQKWHCFNCQRKGNVYQFIEQAEHLSTQEAEQFIDNFINHSLDKEEIRTKVIENSSTEIENTSTQEAALCEPEIAISEPEIIVSEPEIIPEADNITTIKKLLGSFHECTGCEGIAIVHNSDNDLIGSSITDFDNKDIQAFNTFIKGTLKLATDILGDFDVESTKLIFRMNVTIKSVQKKLIWIPMLSKKQHKYNLLMLLDDKTSERMLLIKLKNRLTTLDM